MTLCYTVYKLQLAYLHDLPSFSVSLSIIVHVKGHFMARKISTCCSGNHHTAMKYSPETAKGRWTGTVRFWEHSKETSCHYPKLVSKVVKELLLINRNGLFSQTASARHKLTISSRDANCKFSVNKLHYTVHFPIYSFFFQTSIQNCLSFSDHWDSFTRK